MLKHILIVVSYGMLAVAVGLVSPDLVPAVVPPVNWFAAGMVFLGGALAHESHVRATMAGQIHALGSENFALSRQVDNLGAAMDALGENIGELNADGANKAKQELDRVVAEVRVLQNLIEQLSASRFMPGKTPAPAKPKPAGPKPAGPKSAGPKSAGPKSAGKDNWPAPEPGRAPARANGTVYGLDEKEVLDIVREGLRKDRVDLYLQPIVSLPQRKTRFYECFSRIRAENGTVIRPDQYIDLAKGEGLMGAIDNMLLFRCVQLVRNAQTHSENVGFFCNISANTLMDRKFFTDFVGFMAANEGLARNLIFEFSQTDLDTHRQEIGEYAARLGQFGFNFSLDRVEDLTKLNLEILAALGFRYIKIDARKFLEMPREKDQPAMAEGAGEAELEPVLEADTVVGIDIALLKRTMDLHGIDLIVEKLEKEQNLVELLEYRIDFGQGYLFGEPRLSD